MKKCLYFVFMILNFVLIVSLNAQTTNSNNDLESSLSRLSSKLGTAYLNPIIPSFGSNLNSGWVSKVPEAKRLTFYIDLKIVAMGSYFSDKPKDFSINDQFYFNDSQTKSILANSGIYPSDSRYTNYYNQIYNKPFDVTATGPTIVGSKNKFLSIYYPGNTLLNVQPYTITEQGVKGLLEELPLFPTGAVQLTLGTVMGTNVSFRYCPPIQIDQLGKFDYFGIGFIHNPGVWFPNGLPIDIGLGFFTQKMKLGNIFESTATQTGIYFSKTFGSIVSITPYAGYSIESSKTSVTYTYQPNQSSTNGVLVNPVTLSLDLEGENSSSFVVGTTIHLVFINISADYKFAKTKTLSAGLSFGL